MKTILYQPLFINPQAYFVFPQLYHIEKGDSYIEPANITGQLIINNLSEGLTLTPTVNVIQDSNQVDFSLFKGKHIRISQYTNIGAVVLGEMFLLLVKKFLIIKKKLIFIMISEQIRILKLMLN